jgi:uncharacterized membrane protein YkoI
MSIVRRYLSPGCRIAAIVLSASLAAATAHAQVRATNLQTMSQEARVSKDAARITALSRVPGGRMSSLELRRGIGGKLVYTAMIAETGKPQKTEVVIDAMTGAVISKRP